MAFEKPQIPGAELGPSIPLRMGFPVFLPQQVQGNAGPLHFTVQVFQVRFGFHSGFCPACRVHDGGQFVFLQGKGVFDTGPVNPEQHGVHRSH